MFIWLQLSALLCLKHLGVNGTKKLPAVIRIFVFLQLNTFVFSPVFFSPLCDKYSFSTLSSDWAGEKNSLFIPLMRLALKTELLSQCSRRWWPWGQCGGFVTRPADPHWGPCRCSRHVVQASCLLLPRPFDPVFAPQKSVGRIFCALCTQKPSPDLSDTSVVPPCH